MTLAHDLQIGETKISQLDQHRKRVDLTQQEVAEAIGASTSTIANWERGRSTTYIEWVDRLNKLCIKLNCSLADLILYPEQITLESLSTQLRLFREKVSALQFRELLEKTYLSPEFIAPYIHFENTKFRKTLIFRDQDGLLDVYVIGWKPKQFTDIHHHGNSLGAILVLKGNLTHWFPESHEPSQVFQEGSLIVVDYNQSHQLGNASSEDLVTLEFRLGRPQDCESNARPIFWNLPEIQSK